MAEQRKSFPMLPVGHWWNLRRKFKQSIPGVVTDTYLATVLEMSKESARANVLPFLKVMGILDEEGKPNDLAKLWRDDSNYSEACRRIVESVYPKELTDAVPDPKNDRDGAKRWFGNHTGSGNSACTRMAALYTVLVEADPNMQESAKVKLANKPMQAAKPKPKKSSEIKSTEKVESVQALIDSPKSSKSEDNGLGIHINMQIHISADSSPDQIEQIFASMAKHIYRRN